MSDRQPSRAFVVEVAALLRQPGARRQVRVVAPIADLSITSARVDDHAEVEADLTLESVHGGILVSGVVTAPWTGECRRCLEVASGVLRASVRELCCPDGDEETTYPLSGALLDLGLIVHDACILELPLAPLCGADCAGLCPQCGANRNLEPCSCTRAPDDRWAALSTLLGEQAQEPSE